MRRCTVSLLFAIVAAFHSPAGAATGLFTVERIFYNEGIGKYTRYPATFPTAPGYVSTAPFPGFTVPQSAIKNTTYSRACTFMFPGPYCRLGYPASSANYSYWNLKGSFGPNNPNAPTTSTTVRVRTVFDGWPGSATYPVPQAYYTRVTPTEGGCAVNGTTITTPADCPGTTQFSGRYTGTRAGSIMIVPGKNRFGGTMRFFTGPNQQYYQLATISGPYSGGYGGGRPNVSTSLPSEVGQVETGRHIDRYRLTEPSHILRVVYGTTIPSSASCAPGTGTVRPPMTPGCNYYVKKVQYVSTIVPFTTGMVTGWQPVGNTSTITTLTGYDNRTPAGLTGKISMVRPRLVHAYSVRPQGPDPIRHDRSNLRAWRINFDFAGSAPDSDGDGIPDLIDNCSAVANPTQDDTDGDDCGNLCDADYNNDGIAGFADLAEFFNAFGSTDEEKVHRDPVSGETPGYPEHGFWVKAFGTVPGPSGTTAGTVACP